MKHRLAIAISIALLGVLVYASPAGAQRGFGARSAPAGRAAPRGSSGMGGRGAFRFAHPRRAIFRGGTRGWGWGYLPYPDYYDYPDYEPAMTEAPPWQGAAQPAQAAQPERVIHPLLIERQGDQWVQFTGYSQSPAVPSPSKAAEPPQVLPPAVLVFRDGHEEEVKSYTIIGDTLYTSANYWTSGSWKRKIDIANLDVPATLKLNQERGSKFSLPSGPREVVFRP